MTARGGGAPAPTLASVREAIRIGVSARPRLLAGLAAVILAGAILDGILPLVVSCIVQVGTAADALAVAALVTACAAGSWLLQGIAGLLRGRFERQVGITLRSLVASLEASLPTIEHHTRPDYIDRLQLLRSKVYSLEQWYGSALQTASTGIRIAIVLAVALAQVPAAALVLPVAVLPLVVNTLRERALQNTEKNAQRGIREAEELFDVLTGPGPAKDLRVYGLRALFAGRHAEHWAAIVRAQARVRGVFLLALLGAWAVFALAVAWILSWQAQAGQPQLLVLLVTSVLQLGALVGLVGTESTYLRRWTESIREFAWFSSLRRPAPADTAAAAGVRAAVRFEGVSFAYSAGAPPVIKDWNLRLPAHSVVSLVGVNGAGKTTATLLLLGLLAPTAGRILYQDTRAEADPATDGADRTVVAQNYARFEYPLHEAIGLGDAHERGRDIETAGERAGLAQVRERYEAGGYVRLGGQWRDGMELSGGQWQRVALARAFAHGGSTSIAVFDEPSSALDPGAEAELYASLLAARTDHLLTVFISHRLISSATADLVVVVDDGRILDTGTHEELLDRCEPYATLYRAQQRAYA